MSGLYVFNQKNEEFTRETCRRGPRKVPRLTSLMTFDYSNFLKSWREIHDTLKGNYKIFR